MDEVSGENKILYIKLYCNLDSIVKHTGIIIRYNNISYRVDFDPSITKSNNKAIITECKNDELLSVGYHVIDLHSCMYEIEEEESMEHWVNRVCNVYEDDIYNVSSINCRYHVSLSVLKICNELELHEKLTNNICNRTEEFIKKCITLNTSSILVFIYSIIHNLLCAIRNITGANNGIFNLLLFFFLAISLIILFFCILIKVIATYVNNNDVRRGVNEDINATMSNIISDVNNNILLEFSDIVSSEGHKYMELACERFISNNPDSHIKSYIQSIFPLRQQIST